MHMLDLEFCGEHFPMPPDRPFTIGREADLSIDDNRFLHRRFLEIGLLDTMWWIVNVGSQLAATMSDAQGCLQAWLAPGARMPIVFANTTIRFTAGPTCYELALALSEPVFTAPEPAAQEADGTTTIGRVALTPDQRLLIVALAEPALLDGRSTPANLPSSVEAAERLGWTITKFNRKLDNVCAKLAKSGVRGLHGGPQKLAAGRRNRLVEYALAVRLIGPEDVFLLDEAALAEVGD